VAYELLFRPGDAKDAGKIDPDTATSSVILNTFAEIGLENLVGESLVHINVSRRFLLAAELPPLPSDRVVLEVPGAIEADELTLAAMSNLRARGYRIALDNFVYDRSRHRVVESADIVKLDVVGRDQRVIAQQVAALAPYTAQPLAAKVENYELFEACRSLGFDLYQGYFFCTPKLVTTKGIPSSHLDRLRLIARLEAPDVEFEELKTLISRDIDLSYRFLRYANSAFFSMRRKVDSVQDALVLLGEQTVKRWTTLIVLGHTVKAARADRHRAGARPHVRAARRAVRRAGARCVLHHRPVLRCRRAHGRADGRGGRVAALLGRHLGGAGARARAQGRGAARRDRPRARRDGGLVGAQRCSAEQRVHARRRLGRGGRARVALSAAATSSRAPG